MKQFLASAPKGSLSRRSDGVIGASIRENGEQFQMTLRTKDNLLLKQLKDKRYMTKAVPILESKIKACRKFLELDKIYDPLQIEQILPLQYATPSADVFLKGDINPGDLSAYNSNPLYPENLIHTTAYGVKVRSKSEALIGTQLEMHGLLYQYEPEIRCGSKPYYPDFAVLHPVLRRLIYWEHFGMIDDPEYMRHALMKLDEYAKNGIYLGINLIITYETRFSPLTISEIDRKINYIMSL